MSGSTFESLSCFLVRGRFTGVQGQEAHTSPSGFPLHGLYTWRCACFDVRKEGRSKGPGEAPAAPGRFPCIMDS